MGIFDDNPFVTLGPRRISGENPAPPTPDEVAQGKWWGLYFRGGVHVLEYMSGELYGRAREVTIDAAEAEALKASGDDATATRIIVAHGGS